MSLFNLLTIGVLTGVQNKFPDGIETKMDASKEAIVLKQQVSASVALSNELKAKEADAQKAKVKLEEEIAELKAENERLIAELEKASGDDVEKPTSRRKAK